MKLYISLSETPNLPAVRTNLPAVRTNLPAVRTSPKKPTADLPVVKDAEFAKEAPSKKKSTVKTKAKTGKKSRSDKVYRQKDTIGRNDSMTPKQNADWWAKLNEKERSQYLKDHPESKMAKRHIGIMKNATHIAMGKIRGTIRKNRMEYKEGFDGIKSFKYGRPLSDSQKAGVKKIVKTAAVVVVAGLALAMMFTPLGGAAMQMTSDYINHLGGVAADVDDLFKGNGSGAVASDTTDDKCVDEFLDNFHKWVLTQDISKYSKS